MSNHDEYLSDCLSEFYLRNWVLDLFIFDIRALKVYTNIHPFAREWRGTYENSEHVALNKVNYFVFDDFVFWPET